MWRACGSHPHQVLLATWKFAFWCLSCLSSSIKASVLGFVDLAPVTGWDKKFDLWFRSLYGSTNDHLRSSLRYISPVVGVWSNCWNMVTNVWNSLDFTYWWKLPWVGNPNCNVVIVMKIAIMIMVGLKFTILLCIVGSLHCRMTQTCMLIWQQSNMRIICIKSSHVMQKDSLAIDFETFNFHI